MEAKRFIKLGMVAAVLACGMSLSSCCGGNGELTKGDVEDEVERMVGRWWDYHQTTTVKTGYYELNDAEDRLKLVKLAAAGMITYKATNIIETKKTRWYGTRKYDHVFVEVALTEEGKKYVVSDEEYEKIQKEIEESRLDKDLMTPNTDKTYPEDAVAGEGDIPVIDDEPVQAEGDMDRLTDEDNAQLKKELQAPSSAATAVAPKKQPSAYEQAKEKENSTYVRVKSHKIELYKVRDIKCTQTMLENGEAKAVIILETVDVTPFGRILDGKADGEKKAEKVEFSLYTDGWRGVM